MNIRAALLSGSLMIAAVALLRLLCGTRLPRRLFPALWCLTAVRMLLPAAIPSVFSIWNLLRPAPSGRVSGAAETLYAFAAAGTPAAAAQPGSDFGGSRLLTAIWLAVAAAVALAFFVGYLRSIRRFRGAWKTPQPDVAACVSAYAFSRPVSVRVTFDRRAPLTYGVFRPVVLLPAALCGDATALPFILTHELEHVRRWDCLRKLLLAACLCLYWFNPLVWLMVYLAERDIELACDEAVLLRLGWGRRKAYARMLLELADVRDARAPLCGGFGKSVAEERIRAIMKAKKIPTVVTVVVLLLAVCGLTVFATQAAAPVAAPESPAPAVQAGTEQEPAAAPVPTEPEHVAAPEKTTAPEESSAPLAAKWVNPLAQTELEVTSAFGARSHPVLGTTIWHDGVDLAAAEGDDIYAVADGTVTEVWFDSGAGNCVSVDHGNGYVTAYHHCSEIFAQAGDAVTQGQCIAAVGQTGWATGPHLHLSVYYDGESVDPIAALS